MEGVGRTFLSFSSTYVRREIWELARTRINPAYGEVLYHGLETQFFSGIVPPILIIGYGIVLQTSEGRKNSVFLIGPQLPMRNVPQGILFLICCMLPSLEFVPDKRIWF